MHFGEFKSQSRYIGKSGWSSNKQCASILDLMCQGISKEDATNIINTMAKYPKFFVDHMVVEELGIMPPDPDDAPAKKGLVTFLSFVIFGSVPMIVYSILLHVDSVTDDVKFIIACVFSGLTMFLLGVLKGSFVSRKKQEWAISGNFPNLIDAC